MSIASKRGQDLEKRIAKALRRIGITAYRDKRSGAGQVFKADIAAPGFDFSVEAKNQETIKLRDWWKQTQAATPGYKQPLLVVALNDYEELAILKLDDLLQLIKQNRDDTETIVELRRLVGDIRTSV